MATVQCFSFANSKFLATVAHGGRGEILFARVNHHEPRSGCNWIDLTVLSAGTSIGLHTHGPRDEEIYVVVSGQGRMSLGADTFVTSFRIHRAVRTVWKTSGKR